MSRPKQIEIFEQIHRGRVQRQVVYVPPTPDVIDKYAYAVCSALEQGGGKDQRSTEFARGFATFVKVVVRITAKHLNQGVESCPVEK